MLRDKKGAGSIILWVLMVGLVVTLGVSAGMWQIMKTQEFGESLVKPLYGATDCQEMNFLAIPYNKSCGTIKLKNNGYFNIHGFAVRTYNSSGVGSKIIDAEVNAQKTKLLDINMSHADDLEFIPLIIRDGEILGCYDRVRAVNCTNLE